MNSQETTSPAAQAKPEAVAPAPAPVADNPPKYVPQFSAATEMILKRINSGASASNLTAISNSGPTVAYTGGSAKYEDMRRSVLMGMKTSMNMEIPPTPNSEKQRRARENKTKTASSTPGATPSASGSASGKGKSKGKGKKVGGKRKRTQDSESLSEEEESEGEMSQLGGDSEEEDGGSVASLPKITQSGRQVNKPSSYIPSNYEPSPKKRATQTKRTQEQALCKRCGRGNSPDKNMIVFCDGCNLCWHQLCHDPAISDETVKDEVAPWFCVDCSRKRGGKPAAGDHRGVSWQGRTADDKRNYFSSLPHTQLVSLLMQTTILYPNVPIFPAPPTYMQPNKAASKTTAYQQSAASAAGLFSRSESNPRASMNFIRKIPAGQSSTPTPPQTSYQTLSTTQNLNQNPPATTGDSRESTPASPAYPKPGNGLMAKLGPDEEDNEWLVDADGDFEAFSHTVYDDQGVPTQTGGIVAESDLLGDGVNASDGFNAAFGVGNANPGVGVNGVGAIHGHGL